LHQHLTATEQVDTGNIHISSSAGDEGVRNQ
jgi:hypothetical protein